MDIKIPERKTEVSIDTIMENQRIVYLYATQSAADDIFKFGYMRFLESKPDWYQLEVDPRYDWNEVLEYIKHYDEIVELDQSVWGSVNA